MAYSNLSTYAVIVSISKASSKGDTSFVHACRLANDGSIDEGNPFCLSNKEKLYIWNNVDVSMEQLQVGVIARYRIIQNQYVYEEKTAKILVSYLCLWNRLLGSYLFEIFCTYILDINIFKLFLAK